MVVTLSSTCSIVDTSREGVSSGLVELSLQSPVSELPKPRSVSQLMADIEEWKKDSSRTKLVLSSVSGESFLALKPLFGVSVSYKSSDQHFVIKTLYSCQHQQVKLSKVSWEIWTASRRLVKVIFDGIIDVGHELGDVRKGICWKNTLRHRMSDGYFCREGEATENWFTYMRGDCCVRLPTIESESKKPYCFYDEVLPTLVVLSGVGTWDKEIKEDVGMWLGKRKGLSTEVNAVIYQSLNFDDTSLCIELSLFSRPTHYDASTDTPSIILDPSYHLCSQIKWKEELQVTAEIPGSLSLPPSVLWGIGNCPDGFPDNERITFTAEDLGRHASGLLMDHRHQLAVEERERLQRLQKLEGGLVGV